MRASGLFSTARADPWLVHPFPEFASGRTPSTRRRVRPLRFEVSEGRSLPSARASSLIIPLRAMPCLSSWIRGVTDDATPLSIATTFFSLSGDRTLYPCLASHCVARGTQAYIRL